MQIQQRLECKEYELWYKSPVINIVITVFTSNHALKNQNQLNTVSLEKEIHEFMHTLAWAAKTDIILNAAC